MPPDTQLTARNEGIPAWDDLSADQQRIAARLMETYAGFAEHTDYHAGRLIDALETMGALDNTLLIFIAAATTERAPKAPSTEPTMSC